MGEKRVVGKTGKRVVAGGRASKIKYGTVLPKVAKRAKHWVIMSITWTRAAWQTMTWGKSGRPFPHALPPSPRQVRTMTTTTTAPMGEGRLPEAPPALDCMTHYRLVDLSVPLSDEVSGSDPPGYEPKIERLTHQ